MTKDGTAKLSTTMYKNEKRVKKKKKKSGTAIFANMYNGGQYEYLQPYTR